MADFCSPALVDIASFFTGLGVNRVNFIFPLFLTKTTGEAQSRLMLEYFGTETKFWRRFANEPPNMNMATLKQQVSLVGERFPICRFNPDPAAVDLETFFRRPDLPFRHQDGGTCLVPWRVLEVLGGGDVVTCRDINDYVVGNIRIESLEDIWNGERMKKYRRYMLEHGKYPICARCCQQDGYSNQESRAYVVR